MGEYLRLLSSQWRLEAVNEKGISVVWDELFERDMDAPAIALNTLSEDGISAFRTKRQRYERENR